MGSIVLLDDLTINKIAAGEVIERPANVVKELIENSIDAGATKIDVDIENGGISLIRITDNGKGIAPDDVEMAFERHATSKIRKAADLIKVSTMGFRGEALASIASIAKVEMVTRTIENEMGTRIIVEGGNVIEKEECGAPFGTTITIRELFYNTPVRYKFLKKDYTEGGYIEDVISRTALINPSIMFKLTNNKKESIKTSGNGDITEVVYNVYGKEISKSLVDVDLEYEGIKVTGVVGKPEIARSNRTNQLFYINGRFIKDKILSAATEEAYRTLVPVGKYGFCILNIKMSPELVDVNVHPAKLEVRFSEEGKVFKAVNYAVKDALLKRDITVSDQTDENRNEEIKENEQAISEPEHKKGLFDIFRPKSIYSEEKKQAKIIPLNENVVTYNTEYAAENDEIKNDLEDVNKTDDRNTEIIDDEQPIENETAEQTIGKKEITLFDNSEIGVDNIVPEYKILGVAFSTYILLELDDEDIYILDQHAAHERVLYEKVKENFYKQGGKESQMLLMPDIVELSKRDMHIVRDHIELFEQAGFSLEEFGDTTMKINGVPEVCFDTDTKSLFLEILDGIDITNRTTKQDIEEKFIATVACKAAVKAHMKLDESEIKALLDQLLVLENPFTCPHGRPTAIRITKTEIEKKFGRR